MPSSSVNTGFGNNAPGFRESVEELEQQIPGEFLDY